MTSPESTGRPPRAPGLVSVLAVLATAVVVALSTGAAGVAPRDAAALACEGPSAAALDACQAAKKDKKEKDKKPGKKKPGKDKDKDKEKEKKPKKPRKDVDRDRLRPVTRLEREATWIVEAGPPGRSEVFQATFSAPLLGDWELACFSLDRPWAAWPSRSDPPRGSLGVEEGDEALVRYLGDACMPLVQRVTVTGQETLRVLAGPRLASVTVWVGEAEGPDGTMDTFRWSASSGMLVDWDVPSRGVAGSLLETNLRAATWL